MKSTTKPRCAIIDNKLFFLYKPLMGKKRFLSRMKIVPNSYMGYVFSRLYDAHFSHAANLWWEYMRYYRHEFPSIEAFLRGRYNLNDSEVKLFGNIRSYCSRPEGVIDYRIESLMEDEAISELFWKISGGKLDNEN